MAKTSNPGPVQTVPKDFSSATAPVIFGHPRPDEFFLGSDRVAGVSTFLAGGQP